MSTPIRGNVPGPFRVTSECIICAICADVAPEHFRLGDDEDANIVYRQPVTKAEVELCREALHNCPTEAIEEARG
jgi:ferredoxin